MEIVANWKQFLSPEQEIALSHDLMRSISLFSPHSLTILPSSLVVREIVEMLNHAPHLVTVGVQNIGISLAGAQTGDIRADYVPVNTILIGHSERERNNHETIADNLQKLTVALSLNKKVILCFGEKDQVANDEELLLLIKSQLANYRRSLSDEMINAVTLAYEPQWSVGNTTTASSTIVKKVLALTQTFGFPKMLYGGSIDSTTLKHVYFPKLNGFLIGRASTDITSLQAIFTALNELTK